MAHADTPPSPAECFSEKRCLCPGLVRAVLTDSFVRWLSYKESGGHAEKGCRDEEEVGGCSHQKMGEHRRDGWRCF